MKNEDKNIDALINLLEDPDKEIYNAVSKKLISIGADYLSLLEQSLNSSNTLLQHERLDTIITEIKNNTLGDRILSWTKSEPRSLLDGWIIASSIQHPDISKEKIDKFISQLVNDVWLELNDSLTSLEKTSVINHIFFNLHHFELNNSDLTAPENCFIDNLLITKQGNYISLALLYYVVAHQLQLPIVPISFKENLLLGYYDPSVAYEAFGQDSDPYLFYINPEHKGAIIGTRELEYILQREHKELKQIRVIEDEISLVKRLLYYIKRCYHSKGLNGKELLTEKLITKLFE